jgi:hypothetical protein
VKQEKKKAATWEHLWGPGRGGGKRERNEENEEVVAVQTPWGHPSWWKLETSQVLTSPNRNTWYIRTGDVAQW